MKAPSVARPRWLMLVMLLVLAVFAVGCGDDDDGNSTASSSSSPSNPQQVTLRLGWTYGGPFTPIYLGVEKGFFKDRGIDLKIEEGKGTVPSASTVASGKDDFGYFDMGAAARLIDEGVPLVGVAQIRQKTSMSVISLAKTGIEEPEDLYGKSVSNTPGDSLSQVWPAFVAANDLDDDKIDRQGLDASVYVKALTDGKIDAILGYEDWEAFTLQSEGEKINVMPFAEHGVTLVDYGFVTSKKLVEEDPEIVRAFVAAVSESFDYAADHVDEAVALGQEQFPESDAKLTRRQLEFQPTLYGDSVEDGEPVGWIDEKVWEDSIATLGKNEPLKNADPSAYYTNEFFEN